MIITKMKQFAYSRKVTVPPKAEGEKETYQYFTDSFNPECVVRTISMEDGSLLVALNDGHEEEREAYIKNKQGKYTGGTRNVRVFVQSEIVLEPKDAERFRSRYFITDREEMNKQAVLFNTENQ